MKTPREQLARISNRSKSKTNHINLNDTNQMFDKLAKLNANSTSDYNMIVQTVTNYIKSFESKPAILAKAEKLLVSWITLTKQEQRPVQEKIIKLLLLTINSWSSYYQSKANLSVALSYLTKYQDLINNTEIKTPGLCRLIASTLYSASSISIEIKQFKIALSYAQESLQYLQKKQNISDSLSLFISCHYNQAVCNLNLGRKADAEEAFSIAFKSRKCLPNGHYLIPVINLAYKKYKLGEITPLLVRCTKNPIPVEMNGYYSGKQLVKAKFQIDNEHKIAFVDTDKYFYNKISSMMGLNNDVKNISAAPLIINGSDKEEKKSLSKLRHRKFNSKPCEFNKSSELLHLNSKTEQKPKHKHSNSLRPTETIFAIRGYHSQNRKASIRSVSHKRLPISFKNEPDKQSDELYKKKLRKFRTIDDNLDNNDDHEQLVRKTARRKTTDNQIRSHKRVPIDYSIKTRMSLDNKNNNA